MNLINIRFPQKKEYNDKYRNNILDLLKTNKYGLKIVFKPKYKEKHWWDIGKVLETDLLNLIRYDKKKIYVYSDPNFKKMHTKLYCNSFNELETTYLDRTYYKNYDFNDQHSVKKLYRIILGAPYYYLIITN